MSHLIIPSPISARIQTGSEFPMRMIDVSCRVDLLIRSRPISTQTPCRCSAEPITKTARLSRQGSRNTIFPQIEPLASPVLLASGGWQRLLPRTGGSRSQKKQSKAGSSLIDEQGIQRVSSAAANLFPLWLIIAAFAAILRPQLFLWFQKDYVTAGLAITMLSMGTSLTLEVSRENMICLLLYCALLPNLYHSQISEEIC
jgi:hypothetical protein